MEGSIAILGCHNGTHSSYAILDISNPTNPAFYSDYNFTDSSVQLVGGTIRDDLLFLLAEEYTQTQY